MKVSIVRVIVTGTLLTAVLGALIQRHFAQNRNTAGSNSVLSKQQGREAESGLGFDSDGLEFERKLVKNAPISATLTIETVHSSADGNSLARTATSLIYRDGRGRTRRDRMPAQASSTVAVSDQQPQITTINDPVAGFAYALDHRARLYRRTVFLSLREPGSDNSKAVIKSASSGTEPPANLQILSAAAASGHSLRGAAALSSPEAIREPLGQREIEGLTTEGNRVTMTVPAGAAGNEQPLNIVAERWYSPELKTTILVKRSDPRFGEAVYRLTNIKRGDPPATLFVLPSGYKITDETAQGESFRN